MQDASQHSIVSMVTLFQFASTMTWVPAKKAFDGICLPHDDIDVSSEVEMCFKMNPRYLAEEKLHGCDCGLSKVPRLCLFVTCKT